LATYKVRSEGLIRQENKAGRIFAEIALQI